MTRRITAKVVRPEAVDGAFSDRLNQTHIASILIKVDELSADQVARYERHGVRVTHQAYVPGAPDISAGDRVEFSQTLDGGAEESRSLEVVGVRRIRKPDGRPHHTTIELLEDRRIG